MHPILTAVIIAQQLLPGAGVVHGAVADMREPRVAVGFIATNLLADELIARPGQAFPANEEAARDVQGVVELGTNFPLIRFGGVTVSLQGGALSRFRLERSDNDAFTVDYMVAFPFNYSRGGWEGRIRLIHRSAHLGDEVVQNVGLRRLEYDHEEVDALVAHRLGPIRVYGGASLTIASSFEEDDWGVQAGVEGRRGVGATTVIYGGIDWQRHSIQDGNSRVAAVAGVELRGEAGRLGIEALYGSGAAASGEFFLERERFWGARIILRQFK